LPIPPILYSTANGTATAATTNTTTATSMNHDTADGSVPPFALTNVQAATLLRPSTLTTTATAKGIGGGSLLQVGGTVTIAATLATLTFVLVTVRGKTKPSVVSA